VLIITCTVFGLAGAYLGWWKDTRQLYRRPGSKWNDTVPAHRIRSEILARRRRRRFLTTAEFAFYGAALGAGLFWALQRLAR
jgi:hypothetical protein